MLRREDADGIFFSTPPTAWPVVGMGFIGVLVVETLFVALTWLAAHPGRHFYGDEPPKFLVGALASVATAYGAYLVLRHAWTPTVLRVNANGIAVLSPTFYARRNQTLHKSRVRRIIARNLGAHLLDSRVKGRLEIYCSWRLPILLWNGYDLGELASIRDEIVRCLASSERNIVQSKKIIPLG